MPLSSVCWSIKNCKGWLRDRLLHSSTAVSLAPTRFDSEDVNLQNKGLVSRVGGWGAKLRPPPPPPGGEGGGQECYNPIKQLKVLGGKFFPLIKENWEFCLFVCLFVLADLRTQATFFCVSKHCEGFNLVLQESPTGIWQEKKNQDTHSQLLRFKGPNTISKLNLGL